VNEFLAEAVPYHGTGIKNNFQDFIKRVDQGEESGKHRPTLASCEIKVLKEIILKCWRQRPEERPSFDQLHKEQWDTYKFSLITDDKEINQKILQLYKDQKSIKCGSIIRAFGDVYNENQRLYIQDVTNGPFNGYFVRTLMAALNVGNGSDQVTDEHVHRVINWIKGTRKSEVLDVMYKVFTDNYFFGILDADSSSRILSRNNKRGAYLIRAELSGAFFLDYFPRNKDKKILNPQSIKLDFATLEKLANGYKQILTLNNLKKEKYCTIGRPEVLSGLRIRESYITAENHRYLTNAKRQGPPTVAPVTTVSHYDLIF